jgi:GTP-binding protein EngB required for normal cell division
MNASPPVSLSTVQAALGVATDVAAPDELPDVQRLVQRCGELRLRVLVVGEAKRGKSTLVNALLDRVVLPTGMTPLTSVVTTVGAAASGHREGATVTFRDGATRLVSLAELADYVTEAGNPLNGKGVDHVLVHLVGTWLSRLPVELVDTPGTGSVFTHNTEEAQAALEGLDALIMVLSVDPPITGSERELLGQAVAHAVHSFLLVNKADRFTADEIAQSVAFTKEVCAGIPNAPSELYVCSAAQGLRDSGFASLRRDLLGYLRGNASVDAATALAWHTQRLVRSMLDVRRVQSRTLEMSRAGDLAAVDALRTRLEIIAGRRSEIHARVDGSLRQIRRSLDAEAAAAVPRVEAGAHHALDAVWQDVVEATGLPELEAAGRQVVEGSLRALVDAWRAGEATALEEQLSRLVEQTAADLTAQVELANRAVGEALAVELAPVDEPPRLPSPQRFHYDFSEPATWELPLHGIGERMLPASTRQQRVRRRLDEAVTALSDRQVGRARADLQSRLADAGRALGAALDAYLANTIGRLKKAVARAAAPEAGGTAGRIDRLGEELARLEGLLAELAPTSEQHESRTP